MSNNRRISPLSWATLIFILSPVISLQETADPSMPYVIAMILPTIYYAISKHTIIHVSTPQKCAILLWFLGAISSVVGPYGALDIRYIKYFLFVFFFICVTSSRYSIFDLTFICKNYIIIAVIISILIFLSYFYGYTHNESIYFMSRYSVGITGVYKNPNYLTSFMNVALLILSYLVFFGSISRKRKYIYSAIVVAFFVSFYLSGTRASLMVGGIIILSIMMQNLISKRNPILGILPIVIFAIVAINFSTQINELWSLFLGNRSATGDESRTLAWGMAVNQISENPFFGCGLYAWDHFGKNNIYLEWLHNIFLELVLNQGIIGALLCFIMIFSGLNKIKHNDIFFVVLFIFVTGFPLFFQNGLIAVNFWRFVILTRIVIDYSIYSEKGITYLLTNKL